MESSLPLDKALVTRFLFPNLNELSVVAASLTFESVALLIGAFEHAVKEIRLEVSKDITRPRFLGILDNLSLVFPDGMFFSFVIWFILWTYAARDRPTC